MSTVFIGEGQISYAGPGAMARGRLHWKSFGTVETDWRCIKRIALRALCVESLHGAEVSARAMPNEPYEVRVRVAGRTENLREAVRIGNEVETALHQWPRAGGGA